MKQHKTALNCDTLEESAAEVDPAFPYRAGLCRLHDLPGSTFPWHWHNEVEIFYLREGALEYHLPGGATRFEAGDAGFVNAGVLHMTRALPGVPCVQEEHIFLPSFLGGVRGGVIENRYIRPLVQNREVDLLVFRAGTEAAAAMAGRMRRAFALSQERGFGYETGIRSELTALWLDMLRAAQPVLSAAAPRADGHLLDDGRIKAMMRYIAEHYGEKIGLSDIAAAALIGERECCRCFQRQLGLSPVEYLLDYRISRACELLQTTEESVTAVGVRCGFSSSSYFGKIFRRKTGCSPREYRAGAHKTV